MRESLEKLSKEEDFETLKTGVEAFYKKNIGFMQLLSDNTTDFSLHIKNAFKMVNINSNDKEKDVEKIKKVLREALKLLEAAEDKAHKLRKNKFRT